LPIPDSPELSGPDELAQVLISLRQAVRSRIDHIGSGKLAPISNEGLRRLISLAYYTSLATEEGRFPRFKLINTDQQEVNLRGAARFNTPIDDVGTMLRLAPSVEDTDAALIIAEVDGELRCAGSILVSDMGIGSRMGRPEIVSVGRGHTLIIRVDGPGRLRATEQGITLILDRGRIRQVVDYILVSQVSELWKQLATRMINQTAAKLGEETRSLFKGTYTLAQRIHKSWSGVLATTIDKQHGGAFAVLPAGGPTENFDIFCKYPARLDFGEDILQFWISCLRHALVKDDQEREKAEYNWLRRREILATKAGIVAGLSAVDGCVVLDRSLKVLGFGGEIRIGAAKGQAAPRMLRDFKTGRPIPEVELEQMGTRHRSAFRLAKVHPGTIIFVVSQDGELRIFCSNEEAVYGFERLHAWVHQYEAE
jgi:hypothetical protein